MAGRIFARGAVYPAVPRMPRGRGGGASGAGRVERAVPVVVAGNCGFELELLAGFGCSVYVEWLPLKFFVAPVSRLVFLAREVVEGLTRNAELGSIEGCR